MNLVEEGGEVKNDRRQVQSVKEGMVSGILITQWTVTGVVMLSLCGTFMDTAGCSERKGGGTSCAVRFAESQDKT